MQASCCDHGLRPRILARHVVMSPVRGFCISTSVAQPANKHATAISNVRYRSVIASLQLGSLFRCVLPLRRPPDDPVCQCRADG
jgi:hypothetical protein